MRTRAWTFPLVVLGLLALAGCGGKLGDVGPEGAPAVVDGDPPGVEHEGAHAHEGLHGGVIVELGKGKFHAELTHDDATRAVDIYLLDSSVKKSVPTAEESVTINLVVVEKPRQFVLPATPLPDDPAGQASHFRLVDEELCESLNAKGVKARLNVTIDGKTYTGNIEVHTHGTHGHKH